MAVSTSRDISNIIINFSTHICCNNFKLILAKVKDFDIKWQPWQSYDKNNSMAGFTIGDRSRITSASKEDESNFIEDIFDDHYKASRGERESPWQRVEWTDDMVRLLKTAVSYVGDQDSNSDCWGGIRRKFAVLLRKGEWKSISKVMAERVINYHVSPQQCEDKINDLSKRYYKLNDMLGRGTSCEVVENPALLDVIDFLSKKQKDEVRKMLSSKHLHYEEMCSYINGNRLHLPHDLTLQCSVQLALKIEMIMVTMMMIKTGKWMAAMTFKRIMLPRGRYAVLRGSVKQLKQGHDPEDVSLGKSLKSQI